MSNRAWHEDSRFRIFTEVDVFIEDGNYLLVENQAFNHRGYYVCCTYQQGRNLDGTMFYVQGEHCGADNDYILGLEKAPWGIARDIIKHSLTSWQKREEMLEADNDDDRCDGISDLIKDAIWCLMHDAKENEKFSYLD